MSRKLTDGQKHQIIELKNLGYASRKIAEEVGTNKTSVNNYLNSVKYNSDCCVNDVAPKERKSLNGITLNKPRILYYDIETSLNVSYHWNVWKTNLTDKQRLVESHLLSHSWAWNDQPVEGSILTIDEVLEHDYERLVLEAWSLFDNADIIIGHNSKRFDVKKINGYFLKFGLPSPSPYKVIDTLQIAKNKFNLTYNSLAYLAKYLEVEQKIDSGGIQTWIDCQNGKQEALDEMLYYNKGDITTLRAVHKRLQGWDNNGVNLSLYNDGKHDMLCPHCSSADIGSIEGKFAYTAKRKYSLYRCGECQAVLRNNVQHGVNKVNKLVKVV